MKPEHQEQKKDTANDPTPTSGDRSDSDVPGQAASGQDRRDVDSDQAQQSHAVRAGGEPGAAKDVPRSEEAKNQEATSQQSRAVSGTTAPRKV